MTRRYLIRGRVQAVGFRNFVWRRAASMGISGWVRNLPDGRVEVVAGGASSMLESLELELRRGPPHAQVESVEIFEVLDEPRTSKTFEIKR